MILITVHINDDVDVSQDLACVDKLKVLADRTRLAVLEILMDPPTHVGSLSSRLNVEQSLMSHHLRVLREAGFVEAVRDGKSICYRVTEATQVMENPKAINLGCFQLHFEPGQLSMKKSS